MENKVTNNNDEFSKYLEGINKEKSYSSNQIIFINCLRKNASGTIFMRICQLVWLFTILGLGISIHFFGLQSTSNFWVIMHLIVIFFVTVVISIYLLLNRRNLSAVNKFLSSAWQSEKKGIACDAASSIFDSFDDSIIGDILSIISSIVAIKYYFESLTYRITGVNHELHKVGLKGINENKVIFSRVYSFFSWMITTIVVAILMIIGANSNTDWFVGRIIPNCCYISFGILSLSYVFGCCFDSKQFYKAYKNYQNKLI